jgi:hypothetical protein
MQNLTVHPGASSFLLGPAHARPRSRALMPTLSPCPLTGRPHLSAAPPPGTVLRPTRQTPLPLCFRRQRAHIARERRARAATGVVRRSGPGPMAPPRRVAPPTPGPPPFPSSFPLYRAAAEPLAPRSRCSTRPPVSTPLPLLLSSARASPLLPAPGPPPPATSSPLSLTDSGRAPPSSAAPW